jgi:hypothetical protein
MQLYDANHYRVLPGVQQPWLDRSHLTPTASPPLPG